MKSSKSVDALIDIAKKKRAIIRIWQKRLKEYDSEVNPEWEHGDKYAARRYEGIAIATRWCIEDLSKL